MKKTTLICGLIAGAIVTAMMLYSAIKCNTSADFEGSMILGFGGMLLAFSLIFVGVKNYRDKQNGGIITFGKAFKIGFTIAFIASTIYVGVWLIEYFFFMPDFYEKYSAHIIAKMQHSGASAAEIQKQIAESKAEGARYRNPFYCAMVTYGEILPLGIVAALLAALILKRKAPKQSVATAV